MSVYRSTYWERHHVASVAAIANLIPLIGVFAFSWNVYSLLILYWVEGLVTVLLAAAKSLFAVRGSPGLPNIEPLHELREKRGGWRPASWMPEVYPRNIPFAASILGFWTIAVLPTSVLYWITAAPVIRPSLSLLIGSVGLVITQLHEFISDYIAGQEYVEVSAQEILREPLHLGLVILTLGLVASASDRSGGLVMLTGIVLVKTMTSIYSIATENTNLPLLSVFDEAFSGDHVEPVQDIDTPDGPVRERVSVDAAPVLLGSLPMIAFGFVHRSTFTILVGLTFAALTDGSVWLVLAIVFVLVVAGARVGSYYLRYGTIEYRRYEEQLVAYDTVLESVQWSAPVGPMSFSIRNTVPDRLLNTGTLEVSDVDPNDRDAQLGPVADLNATIEMLDLPVSDPTRPERDLAVIASSLILALFFLVVPAGLAVSSKINNTQLIGLMIGVGPIFLLPVVLMLWAALRRI